MYIDLIVIHQCEIQVTKQEFNMQCVVYDTLKASTSKNEHKIPSKCVPLFEIHDFNLIYFLNTVSLFKYTSTG